MTTDNRPARPGKTRRAVALGLAMSTVIHLALLRIMWTDAGTYKSGLGVLAALTFGVTGALIATMVVGWLYRQSRQQMVQFFAVALVFSVTVAMIFVELASGNYDLP